jgi:hypothetical protein
MTPQQLRRKIQKLDPQQPVTARFEAIAELKAAVFACVAEINSKTRCPSRP